MIAQKLGVDVAEINKVISSPKNNYADTNKTKKTLARHNY